MIVLQVIALILWPPFCFHMIKLPLKYEIYVDRIVVTTIFCFEYPNNKLLRITVKYMNSCFDM
jgi:hypothetical protein